MNDGVTVCKDAFYSMPLERRKRGEVERGRQRTHECVTRFLLQADLKYDRGVCVYVLQRREIILSKEHVVYLKNRDRVLIY